MKNISILGSTGSIGIQTLEVIRKYPNKYKVVGLTGNSNVDLLIEQIREFKPLKAAIGDVNKKQYLYNNVKQNTEIFCGLDGINEIASMDESDIVVSAIVGIAGLLPTYTAVCKGKIIALANKESLVTAGKLIKDAAATHNAKLIPVDSEHSAIFQSIGMNDKIDISKLIITASGGPFFNTDYSEFKNIKMEDALKHPKWNMGKKISIDSATMMNKGLELIEAVHLFDIDQSNIEICVHPESIVHSLVEFKDGAVIAQLGIPDMKVPIAYALSYPHRLPDIAERLKLTEIGKLSFYEPDYDKFKCLKLARYALSKGDSACIVLNGANEAAVELFLEEKIRFDHIAEYVEKSLNSHIFETINTVEDILRIDDWSRKYVNKLYLERCII